MKNTLKRLFKALSLRKAEKIRESLEYTFKCFVWTFAWMGFALLIALFIMSPIIMLYIIPYAVLTMGLFYFISSTPDYLKLRFNEALAVQ